MTQGNSFLARPITGERKGGRGGFVKGVQVIKSRLRRVDGKCLVSCWMNVLDVWSCICVDGEDE